MSFRLLGGLLTAAAVVTLFTEGCAWDQFEPGPALTAGGAGGTGGSGGGVGGNEGGTGGEGTGGSELPTGCGHIDLLQDTFGDGVTGFIWTVSGPANEDNGPFLSADPGSSQGVYRSSRRYDLTGGTVTIKVLQVPDAAVSMEESAVFRVEHNDGRYAEFRLRSDAIEAGIQQNNGFVQLHPVTVYDALAHAYLRFREQDGTLHWQVSADGSSFTDLATAPVTAAFSDVRRIRVAAGAGRGVSGPVSESRLDDITGQFPGGDFAWCPIRALVDDFDDTFRSDEWLNAGGTSVIPAVEAGGQLVMTLAPGGSGTQAYVSSQAYDLTGDAVTVEVPEVSAVPSTTFFELRGDRSLLSIRIIGRVDMMTMAEVFEVEAVVDSAEEDELVLISAPYDPASFRWLRIRDDQGALRFEHSSDGTEASWMEIATRSPNTVPIDDLLVAMGVTSSAAAMAPGQTRFDNLNNPP